MRHLLLLLDLDTSRWHFFKWKLNLRIRFWTVLYMGMLSGVVSLRYLWGIGKFCEINCGSGDLCNAGERERDGDGDGESK